PHGPPSRLLGVCLAATSLARPEATLLIIAIAVASAVRRRRDLRAAAWWLAPLAAPAVWLVANRLLAGTFFPNTGVAKSHFSRPGFDWTYWIHAVIRLIGQMIAGLFWDPQSPLIWPRVVAVLYIAGAVKIALWAQRERLHLVGVLLILSPFAMILAV